MCVCVCVCVQAVVGAAAAMSGASSSSQFQRLKVEDALSYLDQVNNNNTSIHLQHFHVYACTYMYKQSPLCTGEATVWQPATSLQ